MGWKVYIRGLAESAHPCTTLDRLWLRGRLRYLVSGLKFQDAGRLVGVLCTRTQGALAHQALNHGAFGTLSRSLDGSGARG